MTRNSRHRVAARIARSHRDGFDRFETDLIRLNTIIARAKLAESIEQSGAARDRLSRTMRDCLRVFDRWRTSQRGVRREQRGH